MKHFGMILLALWLLVYWGHWRDFIDVNWFHRPAYERLITWHAEKNHLEPSLVAAVIYTESRFETKAVSGRGAVGLMQLMPDTAQWVAEQQHAAVGNLHDPGDNIRLGAWYLRYLLDEFHSPVLALAAYNAGRGHVEEWIRQYGWQKREPAIDEIPFGETREFVRSVLHHEALYREQWKERKYGSSFI